MNTAMLSPKSGKNVAERTALADFLDREQLEVPTLSRRANVSQGNVYAIRDGRTVPRADTIAVLRKAASELLGREVAATEMFDFGEGRR